MESSWSFLDPCQDQWWQYSQQFVGELQFEVSNLRNVDQKKEKIKRETEVGLKKELLWEGGL